MKTTGENSGKINEIQNKLLIIKNLSESQKIKRMNKQNKTINNFYSLNKTKLTINDHDFVQDKINYNKLPNEIKSSINSSIVIFNENKIIYEEKPIFYDKLYNYIKSRKEPFLRNGVIKMKPRTKTEKIVIHNINNQPKINSFNGSYYKKRNNSVVIISLKDKITNENGDLEKNKSFQPNKVNKRLKNLTMEHLKDLLDMQKEQENKKEIPEYKDNFSDYLDHFNSYLEKTRFNNEININRNFSDETFKINKDEDDKKIKKSSNQNNQHFNLEEERLAKNVMIEDKYSLMEDNNRLKEMIDNKEEIELMESPKKIVIISSGVQCGIENKILDTHNKETNINSINIQSKIVKSNLNHIEVDKKEKNIGDIFGNNIITNAKLRDNIKWEKLKTKEEEEENLLNINLYNSEFIEGKNEIFKLYFKNRINFESRFKLKTPNDLRSKIGNMNMKQDIKISSAKSKNLNSIYHNSYVKEIEQDNIKYIKNKSENSNSLKNDFKKKEKFKKFFQINTDDATDMRYSKNNHKKNKTEYNNKVFFNSDNLEENVKILRKRVHSPIDDNYKIYNNIKYNFNNLETKEQKNNIEKDSKFIDINNNKDDLLKVYTNKNMVKEVNESTLNGKNNYFNDNCNTSNGFNNLQELNFLERNNSKFNNNHINSSKRSKNESILISDQKSPNQKQKERKEFLDKVNWKENKTVRIIKGGIQQNDVVDKNINSNLQNTPNDPLKKMRNSISTIPSFIGNQYFNEDTSKIKFKILKRQLVKEGEKVYNMLDNLKRAQSELEDSKRKFLVDTTDNKLKRFTRSCLKSSL